MAKERLLLLSLDYLLIIVPLFFDFNDVMMLKINNTPNSINDAKYNNNTTLINSIKNRLNHFKW